MELSEFTQALRTKLRNRRAELMERYNKGLDAPEYNKNVGRVIELDEINQTITTILKTSGDNNSE